MCTNCKSILSARFEQWHSTSMELILRGRYHRRQCRNKLTQNLKAMSSECPATVPCNRLPTKLTQNFILTSSESPVTVPCNRVPTKLDQEIKRMNSKHPATVPCNRVLAKFSRSTRVHSSLIHVYLSHWFLPTSLRSQLS